MSIRTRYQLQSTQSWYGLGSGPHSNLAGFERVDQVPSANPSVGSESRPIRPDHPQACSLLETDPSLLRAIENFVSLNAPIEKPIACRARLLAKNVPDRIASILIP